MNMTTLVMDTAPTASQAKSSQKHCWECLRRRLVCDSARPVCNRCRASGIVCPGYSEQKPLRWMKPGRVTARNRQRKNAVAPQDNRKKKLIKTSAGAEDVEDDVKSSSKGADQIRWTSNTVSSYRDALGQLGDRVLSEVTTPKAMNVIMKYDLVCENFAGVEESYIYNTQIYERCSPLKLLLGDARDALPLSTIIQFIPTTLRYLYIVLTLGYQLQDMPRDAGENARNKAKSAIAFWTCQAVRTLNEDLTAEHTRTSDGTMASVLTLCLADQQLQPSTRWRCHYDGLLKMIQLRGGSEKMWREHTHLHTTILTALIGEVFANTTSPSHDLLSALSHPKRLDFLEKAWGNGVSSTYCGSICPGPLFISVVLINHLRKLAASSTPGSCPVLPAYMLPASSISISDSSPSSSPPREDITLSASASALLERVLRFSPETFAECNSTPATRPHWVLVARIFHSAAVLYCILSLQSVSLLPDPSSSPPHHQSHLTASLKLHYDRLLLDLKHAFTTQASLKNCLFWPLVVAGCCAGVHGTAFERAFLADLIKESVKDVRNLIPLFAREILMTFWKSGKTKWDDCFDQPYLLML
ncbi:fungal-specific transcription factor domain-containing protein [Nemania sp. FL0916]|nr:fungal-specific transcription factor domain-containing protein [Nemania sp. FL0916]